MWTRSETRTRTETWRILETWTRAETLARSDHADIPTTMFHTGEMHRTQTAPHHSKPYRSIVYLQDLKHNLQTVRHHVRTMPPCLINVIPHPHATLAHHQTILEHPKTVICQVIITHMRQLRLFTLFRYCFFFFNHSTFNGLALERRFF